MLKLASFRGLAAFAVVMSLAGCANQPHTKRMTTQEYLNYQMALAQSPQKQAEFAAMEAERERCETILK